MINLSIFKAGKYSFDFNKKSLVMGILNVTPDSFSDGGLFNEPEKAVKRALEIQDLGADIIDIGAQSTRPGFKKISSDEEWARLRPVLEKLNGALNIPISIDTFYPEVAEKSLQMGASIINDVTGFKDKRMFEVASKSDCGVVIMFSGDCKNMKDFFENKLAEAQKFGIAKERICLDPGVGFLETRAQDRFVINNLGNFKIDEVACLVGLSRKRFIAELCENGNNIDRLPGTIAANTIAIEKGANIIRVHDVKEGVLAAKTADAILKTREI